jgi:hypothetical protein
LFSHRSETQRTARVRLASSLAAAALTAFLSILLGCGLLPQMCEC